MGKVKVAVVEPGPLVRTRRLTDNHGVLFDDVGERAYAEPTKHVQGWTIRRGRLRRNGRILLLSRDHDVPPEINAGPDHKWRSDGGPDRWAARNLLFKNENTRGAQASAGTDRLERAAVIGLLATVGWLALGAAMFVINSQGSGA